MTSEHEQNLLDAQQVVNDYGHLLASLDGSSLAHAASRLPYPVDTIKSAIHLLLWELRGQSQTVTDSLIQSYVYLAQFVSDQEADTVRRGQQAMSAEQIDAGTLEQAEKAKAIVSRIKLDMENLMEDLRAFL